MLRSTCCRAISASPKRCGAGGPISRSAVSGAFPEWFATEPLLRETRVWALSADHPAAREELTIERLAELPHLVIAATARTSMRSKAMSPTNGLERLVTRSDSGVLQGVLAARGLRRNVAGDDAAFPCGIGGHQPV